MRNRFASAGIAAAHGSRGDLVVPNPAAGAEWSKVLPAGYQYRLLLVTAKLVTSAVVANRFPALQILDGDGNVRFQSADSGAVIAATTAQVSGGLGVSTQAGGSGTSLTLGLPNVLLDAGWTIGSTTPGKDAGDQYSAIRLLVEQLEDADPNEAAGESHGHHHIDLEVYQHGAAR